MVWTVLGVPDDIFSSLLLYFSYRSYPDAGISNLSSLVPVIEQGSMMSITLYNGVVYPRRYTRGDFYSTRSPETSLTDVEKATKITQPLDLTILGAN